MYRQDRAWADSYESQVLNILQTLIPHLAVLSIASDQMDRKCATDFEVKLVGGTIAVRLRRSNCAYRDLTIRVHRDSLKKTELAKIKEGYAFRYFYGWTDDKGAISEWILVDLDKVREVGLLEKEWRWIPNGDGTYFIAIPLEELRSTGCLLAEWPKIKRNVNPHVSSEIGIERAKRRPYAVPVKLTDAERAILNSLPSVDWWEDTP